MAKISARGAKEVARYKLQDGKSAYVACSDGRVLFRDRYGRFSVYCRRGSAEEAKRTAELAAKGFGCVLGTGRG